MEENENECIDMQKRQEALQKFREDLSLPLTERFYSEDELIDLFDFASDFNDDYLRMEVLLCAARFYPTSDELNQRKAIFYSQYSDEARDKCLDDNKASTGMIWDIMRAYSLKDSPSEKKRECLHQIIDNALEITDEEIIQLVDLVYTFDEYEWLKENVDWIGKKAVFKSVLLYEVATYADNKSDTEYSIKLMEELTELEPYNPDFWMVLSRNYLKNNDFDKAISSLDYNIALNPKNALPLVMKGRMLYMLHQDESEVLDIVKQIKRDGIENPDTIRMEAAIYAENGNIQKLIDTYNEYLSKHPDDVSELLPDLVDFVDDESIAPMLDRVYSFQKLTTIEEWLKWALLLHNRGLHSKAGEVIKAYFRNNKEEKPSQQVLDATLRMGLFDVVFHLLYLYDNAVAEETENIDLDNQNFDDWFNFTSSLERWRIDLIRIIASIKTGKYEFALELAKIQKRIMSVQSWMSPDQALEVTGMISILKEAIKLLKKAQETNLKDTYNPFGYWEKDVDEYVDDDETFDDMFDDVFS